MNATDHFLNSPLEGESKSPSTAPGDSVGGYGLDARTGPTPHVPAAPGPLPLKGGAKKNIVVASHNEGKVREIRALLAPLGLTVHSAAELNLPEPEETGQTFEENAALKALASTKGAQMAALADDSGLVVPALDGEPGIYSARWAGPGKDFAVAMARIARELRNRKLDPNGTPAYFVCALVLSDAEGNLRTVRGEVHGTLTYPARGTNGFGYDPIFTATGHTQTFGEMDADEKHRISHRAKAFDALLSHLIKERAA